MDKKALFKRVNSVSIADKMTAKEIMGHRPLIAKDFNLTEKVHCPKDPRANQGASNISFDSYLCKTEDATMQRVLKVAVNALDEAAGTSDIIKHFASLVLQDEGMRVNEAGTRLNSFGEFFVNQLTTYLPTLLIEPTRGLSYSALPVISYGAADKNFKVPAYGWSSEWARTQESPSVNTPSVESIPKEMEVGVNDYRNSITLKFNEQLAIAQAQAAGVGSGLKFDAYAGTFAAIAARFIALKKSYQLLIDELAFNGRKDEKSTLGQDGLAMMTTSDIGAYTAAEAGITGFTNFNALSATQARQLLAFGATAVTSQSGGNIVPNVLFLDLLTFASLIAKTETALDTNPLQYMINNNIYQAIVPVAAWNVAGGAGQGYDNTVSMAAAYVAPQMLFFNNALPMIQTGVGLAGDAIQMKYRTRNSGLTIINKLGITRCQVNRS